MIAAHILLCVALFYSVFCRAVRMDRTTHSPIRLVLQLLGTVAAIGVAVPLHWPAWHPDWFGLALLASITAVQFVTAYYWARHVPPSFTKVPKGPKP